MKNETSNKKFKERNKALQALVDGYFDESEIEVARKSKNPIERLRKIIIETRRVYSGDKAMVITGTGKVAIWLQPRNREPDLIISPKNLAKEVFQKFISE